MSEILSPTPERIAKADHFDRGDPENTSLEHRKPQRLGTAWDRYARDRGAASDKILTEEEMILTRAQIATGWAYIDAYIKGMWGGPVLSRFETGSGGTVPGVPAYALDAQRAVWRMEARLKHQHLITLIQLVLIDGLAADEWARRTGRHPKSGIEILRLALDLMAD